MKETMLKLLTCFGLDKELQLYLRLFKKTPAHKFAVIKISGSMLEDRLDVLSKDIAFLSRLGLYPIVVHGGDRQVVRAVRQRSGTESSAPRAGPERLAARTLNRLSDRFVTAVNREGGSAINANDFSLISASAPQSPGAVGAVTGVNLEKLARICRSGHVPVLAPIGFDAGRPVYVDSDALASGIVRRIRPRKYILITKMGGVFDRENRIISTLDLETDLPALARASAVDTGMMEKLIQLKALLRQIPATVAEICSAENLLQELFTVAGSGTLLRYGGNFVTKRSFRDINTARAKRLLEESFGKALAPGYFKGGVDRILLEKDYACIAIIKKIRGVAYLDKFAVSQSAQGNGLGKTIWNMIRQHYPCLIWRSSISNPVNPWYFKNCDGAQKSGEWIVFWYGLDPRTAQARVPLIAGLPRTMVPLPPGGSPPPGEAVFPNLLPRCLEAAFRNLPENEASDGSQCGHRRRERYGSEGRVEG